MKLKEDMERMQNELKELMKIVNTKTQVVKTEDKKVVIPSLSSTDKDFMASLEELRGSLLESLASKDDLNFLAKRVDSLESLTSGLSKEQERTNKEIEIVKEKLKNLEKQLMDKVSCEQYDSLLALINQLRSSGDNKEDVKPIGPIISSKDINLIRELAGKFGDLETRVNTLSK